MFKAEDGWGGYLMFRMLYDLDPNQVILCELKTCFNKISHYELSQKDVNRLAQYLDHHRTDNRKEEK